ncbi:MAG: glycosyltransferase family 2 protein, partial [Microcystaceae cyanobacterium]
MTIFSAIACSLLLSLQIPATFVLLSRLVKGATRHPPLLPEKATPEMQGKVSVIIPTLNEVERLG